MWTLLPEAAVSCSELLRCGCKKGCKGLCKCVIANLKCTSLCHCCNYGPLCSINYVTQFYIIYMLVIFICIGGL